MRRVKLSLVPAIAGAVGVLLGCASCGDAGQRVKIEQATSAFFAAVAGHRDTAACAELVPQAAQSLQTSDSSCAEQIGKLKLTGGTIDTVRVWGYRAQVLMSKDTVFLARLPSGWKITAAGCRPQPKGPYDCDVEA